VERNYATRSDLRRGYSTQRAVFKMFVPLCFSDLCALAKCHNGGLPFADGDGHVGNDAMTIPDYLAIGLLLMMLLAAARWFAQRKFEL